jgi:hypothetical protein
MPETSLSIGEIWPLMSRVECHSEFGPLPQEARVQSVIMFLGAFFWHDRREKVARREARGVTWMWYAPQVVLVQIMVHSLCDMWPDIVSVHYQFLLIFYLAKSAYLWKNMINIMVIRPLLPLGQNTDQVEPMWIPHQGQSCLRTADLLAFNCLGIFIVRESDLFVLTREIKSGFVQRNKIFRTLLLDGTQQIQDAFWCRDSGLSLSPREPVWDSSAVF